MAKKWVFSSLPYPISGETRPDMKNGEKAGIPFQILPGMTQVEEEVIEFLANDERIQWRRDLGHIQFDHKPSRAEAYKLVEPASRSHILELCSKASPIKDGQIFDGTARAMQRALSGDSLQAQINALQAQIAMLKQQA